MSGYTTCDKCGSSKRIEEWLCQDCLDAEEEPELRDEIDVENFKAHMEKMKRKLIESLPRGMEFIVEEADPPYKIVSIPTHQTEEEFTNLLEDMWEKGYRFVSREVFYHRILNQQCDVRAVFERR